MVGLGSSMNFIYLFIYFLNRVSLFTGLSNRALAVLQLTLKTRLALNSQRSTHLQVLELKVCATAPDLHPSLISKLNTFLGSPVISLALCGIGLLLVS